MGVGRLLSYWEGNFSGAMLNFGRVYIINLSRLSKPSLQFSDSDSPSAEGLNDESFLSTLPATERLLSDACLLPGSSVGPLQDDENLQL